MICRSCLRAASKAQSPLLPKSTRLFTSSAHFSNATPISATQPAPRQGDSASSHNPPAATSTSAAQPFSEKLTPAPSSNLKGQATDAAKKKVVPLVKSSIAAGTPLKGLNFEKNKVDPVALADEEYPEWLWTILSRQEKSSDGVGMGDLFSKSKKQRRVAAKRLRKEQAMNPGMLEPKIPLYEQTLDLPAGDGSVEGAVRAMEARGNLTKAMRDKRRADIKEKNFLKAMG